MLRLLGYFSRSTSIVDLKLWNSLFMIFIWFINNCQFRRVRRAPSLDFIHKFEPNFLKHGLLVLWSDVRNRLGSGFEFFKWGKEASYDPRPPYIHVKILIFIQICMKLGGFVVNRMVSKLGGSHPPLLLSVSSSCIFLYKFENRFLCSNFT